MYQEPTNHICIARGTGHTAAVTSLSPEINFHITLAGSQPSTVTTTLATLPPPQRQLHYYYYWLGSV